MMHFLLNQQNKLHRTQQNGKKKEYGVKRNNTIMIMNEWKNINKLMTNDWIIIKNDNIQLYIW